MEEDQKSVWGTDFPMAADKQNSTPKEDWAAREINPDDAPRAVREYLDTLDDEAFDAATTAKPRFTAHADPAGQWTAARKGEPLDRHWSVRQWRPHFLPVPATT